MKINKYTGPKLMNSKIVESLNEESESIDGELFGFTSMVSDLIKKEWEAVDVVNGYKIMAQEFDKPELNAVLDLLLEDHYTHIGQLEGLLQNEVPEAETIEDAKEVEDVTEPAEVEIEEPEEPEVEVDAPSELLDTEDK